MRKRNGGKDVEWRIVILLSKFDDGKIITLEDGTEKLIEGVWGSQEAIGRMSCLVKE